MTLSQFLALAAFVFAAYALIEARGRNTTAWSALFLSLIALSIAFGWVP